MINQEKQNSIEAPSKSSTENSIRAAGGSLNGTNFVYCKALPNSFEWQAYQEQRMSSLRDLKMKNKRLEEEFFADSAKESSKKAVAASLKANIDALYETPIPHTVLMSSKPAILKKNKKSTSKFQSKDNTSNVTWKEPLADTKFLPVGWMRVPPEVPQLHQPTQANVRDKVQIKNKIKPSTVSNGKRKSTTVADNQTSIPNPTDKSEKNLVKRGKPRKRNNEKNNPTRSIINVDLVDTSCDVKVTGKRGSNTSIENGETSKKSRSSSSKIVNGQCTEAKSQTAAAAQPKPLYSYKLGDVIDAQDKSTKSSLPFQQIKQEASSSSKETGLIVPRYNLDHAMPTDNNNNNSLGFATTSENITAAPPTDLDVKALNIVYQSYYSQLLADAELLLEKEKAPEYESNATAFNYFPRNDPNGNIIVHASSQNRWGKAAYENIFTTAKQLLGNELNDEAWKNVGGFSKASLTAVGQNSMAELNRKSNVNRLTDLGESMDSTSQLTCGHASRSLQSFSTSLGNSTRDNIRQDYRVDTIQPEKRSKLFNLDLTEEEILTRLQPPKLPEIEVCNVLPFTPEWQSYWTDFNRKINDYYSSVQKYSNQMDDLLVDDDWTEYKKGIQRRHQEVEGLKISMGITLPKPPLIRQPLKDTVEVGGYVIRPLGGPIPHANITTCDHSSFRLEIMSDKIDSHQDSINIDTKCNAMTIAIPTGQKPNSCIKLVQITVPPYKKVQNLEIGNPLYNGGRLVISGK